MNPEFTAVEKESIVMLSLKIQRVSEADSRIGSALLTALIANLIGHVDDRVWPRLMEASRLPCGCPGCVCHHLKASLFEALDDQRFDWKEEMERRRAKVREGN